jgi:hypothetical protein
MPQRPGEAAVSFRLSDPDAEAIDRALARLRRSDPFANLSDLMREIAHDWVVRNPERTAPLDADKGKGK